MTIFQKIIAFSVLIVALSISYYFLTKNQTSFLDFSDDSTNVLLTEEDCDLLIRINNNDNISTTSAKYQTELSDCLKNK